MELQWQEGRLEDEYSKSHPEAELFQEGNSHPEADAQPEVNALELVE